MMASLRARFLMVVLLGGLAPLALVGLWVAFRGPRSGEEVLRARLTETMGEIVQSAGRNWITTRSSLLDLAQDERVGGRIGDIPAGGFLPVDQVVLSRYDPAGTVQAVIVAGAEPGIERSMPPGPGRAAAGGASFPVRVPFHDGSGRLAGELVAWVRAEALLPSDLLLSGVGGSVLAALDGDDAPVLPLPIDPELLALPRFEWRGERWVTVSQSMQEPPLRLVLAGPAGAFTEPLRRAARTGSLILLAGSLVAFLLVWVGSGAVVGGLRSLTRASEAVAAGNLAAAVPESGPIEVRRVARAFNTMSASLADTLELATQRETLAALGEYAASLAHEVRNPLTSMRLDLERAAGRLEDGDPSRSLVARAIEELDRLDASVSGALKLARSGRLDLADIDVREPVEAAMRAAAPRFADRRADLRLEAWPADPVMVRAETAAIEQLVLNLLLNAADALDPAGTARLSVDDTGEATRITVDDDGEGIPADRLARVFDPLFSTRAEGTGLGLAVARRIARAHGGTLRLESEPGAGTTATVTLPRASPALS